MRSCVVGLTALIVALGCQEEGSVPISVSVDGRVQKGPFINGTIIAISELDGAGDQTGATFSTTIIDDTGTFEMASVELETSLVRIAADGFYFDERQGKLSDDRLAIFTFADVSDATTINVNLMGHLEAARIKYLVGDEEVSFPEAKSQAHREVLDIFMFSADNVGEAEHLDIGQAGEGNAKLLAMSIMLQGTRSVAELSELLSNIQTDIRTDGVMNSASSGEALMNGARTVDLTAVRTNLEARFDALGLSAVVPDFETQVRYFIDNAPYDFTGGIKYPADGSRPNVLARDANSFEAGRPWPGLGFLAELPPSTQLKIRITRTRGEDVEAEEPGDVEAEEPTTPRDIWMYQGVGGLNWTVTPWSGETGIQEFTAARDGTVDFEAFYFEGTGAATLDYFEYGSDTPSFSKEITWEPSEPNAPED